MAVQIITSRGRAPYDESRVRKSIERTGASPKLVDEITTRVSNSVQSGMTTREVYAMVSKELKKSDRCFACRFNLRPAILKFGPAGFKFEKYVASILRAHKYDTRIPSEELQGSCVRHEVDVIAEKDGRRMFIEAKFRNDYSDHVNLKDTMATWSRFLDLVDGAAIGRCVHFDEAWIITNARFSDRAKEFGVCKGIHMIGWNHPEERSFAELVDNTMLYPITVLDELKQSELDAFSKEGIMLCNELSELEPEDIAQRIGISPERARSLVELCSEVTDGEHGHNGK